MVDVERIGPGDERFGAWHAAIAAAYAEGREPGWWESVESARVYFARAESRTRHVALVATDDAGAVVGGAELSLPLDDDVHTLGVDLGVPGPHRHRGVGQALWEAVQEVAAQEGRAVAQAEVLVPDGAEDWPGARFAEARGLRCLEREHRFVLDLPVAPERLAAPATDDPDDTEVVSWVGPCPEDRLDEWARMRTHMSEDVPIGELSITPRQVDADRVRESDRAMTEQGWTKVRTMALGPDGAGRGYTELLVSAHDERVVVQDDTFVDRAYRGRGLGLRLKAANLGLLQETAGLLGPRRRVQTYCEQDNVAMRRTNARLGFRLVDELREYEGPVSPGAS
ncbi:GNAT family N-acetyltransferase [Nocardioides anomalus]|uniref:GNAT family N-acetyltransferase n=1 Tax=Nocardioides anomalus TaxID=2712223 RepID=A0A6G6WAY0_9ACTN|nr:GNAT family N-acetyltransferase [Nocardioides anomalus]QIG42392.1 GNAT family N-acetyltransferase [Nocardioides anomalus]